MPTLIRFHRTGGPEVFQYDQVPAAPLHQGEVRLKVEAIGLNRAEVMFRTGQYIEEPVFPSTIGYEAGGVIEEAGPGVTDLKPGDRAGVIPGFSMRKYGTYGDSVVLPAEYVIKTPENFSSIEAAASWMQYFTAYLLIEFGHMGAGDHVLITAAASSVGHAAIQLARAVGAHAIATTRKQDKVQPLLEAGATAVINTSESDLLEEVKRLTGGAGPRLIFDPIVGPQLATLCDAAGQSADVFLYGALDPRPAPYPLFAALSKNLTLRSYQLGLIVRDPVRFERAKAWILGHVASGDLKPKIARMFPFTEMVEAHRYMESNDQIGKIIVTVP